MNLFKKIALIASGLIIGGAAVACTPSNPKKNVISIADVLTKANAEEVATKGVVFAKTSDGIYINDGTTSIFVLGGLNANVKDEVKVEGNYAIVNKMPEIKQPTVTVLGSDKATIQPVKKDLAEVAGLNETIKANYGQYYTVSGTLTKNAFGQYAIEKDGSTLFINEKSNVSALTEWELKDVVIDVITTSKATEGWTVSYCKTATDITEVPIDLNAVKEEIFTYVDGKMPSNVYGSLSLVTTYDKIPNVAFTWTVKSGEGITITDNKATVTMPKDDSTVTLVLTLSASGNSVTKEYTVTNKAIRKVEIANLATTSYASKENILVEGKVVLTTRSNGTIFSNIIVDAEGKNFARIDSDETENIKHKVGDEIRVLGTYSVNNGIQRVKAISIETIKESTSTDVDWTKFAVTELVTEQDYINLADGMDIKAGIPLRLYKIVNPYITTSGTTGYNYLRFGPNASAAKNGVVGADKANNTASMSLLALNYILGDNVYKEMFEIGNFSTTAIQNIGTTMYTFLAYNIDAVTCGQFVFAKEAIIHDVKGGIEAELKTLDGMSVQASEAGVLQLPKEIAGTAITWTSNCTFIDMSTGAYTAAAATQDYKFTAAYTIEGSSYTTDVNITFVAAPVTYVSVSDFNALENNNTYNVEGTIIGFGTANPDENNKKVIYGMYISDGKQIAYIQESELVYDSTPANGYEIIYTYGDKTKFEVGDFVKIRGAKKTAAGITVTSDTVFTVTPKLQVAVPMTFEPTAFETVSSKADFATVLAKGTHNLIKVVAEDSNPICFGSSKASDQAICLTNKVRIYFYEGVDSPGTAGIKPDGTHTVATKTIASELNLGAKWWTTLGAEGFDLTTNSTSTATKFTGSFYASLTIISNSFYMITILQPGFNLTAVKAA